MDRDGSAARFGGFVILSVVLLVWAYIILVPPPRLPVSSADGRYYNPCCGVVSLSGGIGSVVNASFKYIIEKDKIGPYVMPVDHAVIADATGIHVLPRKPDLFIRVDSAGSPEWIDITGPQAEYRFERHR